MPNNCTPNPIFKFPDEDWDPAFKGLENIKPAQDRQLFHVDALSLNAPKEGIPQAEFEALRQLTPLRAGRDAQIRKQARSAHHAIQPVLDVVGLHIDAMPDLKWKAMRGLLIENITPAIFTFKVCFQRGRPWNIKQNGWAPMFVKGDNLYPGHPSYPSGHATLAHTFAYFLARLYPQSTMALMTEAANVAFNREVAGVHFASDSEAGRLLAQQMVEAMFDAKLNPNHGTFNAMVQALKLS